MDTINKRNRISYRASATSLLALFMFGLGLSAKAQDHKATIITFDAPGAGTAPGQGTLSFGVNPAGTITGFIRDANNVRHGFVRTLDGTITKFDAPGTGTGPHPGTRAYSINPAGAITGWYTDASGEVHSYVRAPDGSFTTFDVPGAGGVGTGPFPGTAAHFINPAGAIAGLYTDTNYAFHSFLRAPDGEITTFDAPGAGTGSNQGTSVVIFNGGINPAGAITGYVTDSSNVSHGFVRAPDGTIITFDPAGSTFTLSNGINPAGAVTGGYADSNNLSHGFVRAPDGSFTVFDAPGAGTGSGQGTEGFAITPGGVITGISVDANNRMHGFVRAHNGSFTIFDAPGAGTGAFQGTQPVAINPGGLITGIYFDANNTVHGFLRIP